MDEYTGKRATGGGGIGIARRGPNLSLRDPNSESRNSRCCNRLGCSTRANSMKGTQMGYSEKAKPPKPGFRSSSSKAIAGSTSRPFSTDLKKYQQKPPNTSSSTEPDVASSSSRQGSIVVTEPISTAAEICTKISESEDKESAVHDFSMSPTILEEVGSYAVKRNPRAKKPVNLHSGSDSQDTSTSSLGKEGGFRRSFVSRKINQAAKSGSQGPSASSHQYGLGNLSCTSVSDVLPLGSSSSDSGRNRRAGVIKKRDSDGESSSSARSKSLSRPSSIGISNSQRGTISTQSNSFQASSPSTPATRARNWPASRDGVASVRTRRTTIGDSRTKLSEHGSANVLSLPEPVVISPLPQTVFSTDESSLASSSGSVSSEFPSSYAQTDSSNETARSRGITRHDDSSPRPFHGISIERENYRRFNMEGIAEVLLALDRIGHDEELTYEQLLIIETSAFLGGLSFHDQHRDMRLDIDNMSYEELLALEEKMGSVSTALTEEALSNCLRRSCYKPDPSTSELAGFREDDIKCSICQEEYVLGDEIGRLRCEHRYHVGCIQQWLRQKNWCPICKASASPS